MVIRDFWQDIRRKRWTDRQPNPRRQKVNPIQNIAKYRAIESVFKLVFFVTNQDVHSPQLLLFDAVECEQQIIKLQNLLKRIRLLLLKI